MTVANQSFAGLSAFLPETAIYTVPSDGLYRVSIYAETSDATSGHSVIVSASFTNEYGQIVPVTLGLGRATDGPSIQEIEFPAFCKSSTTISISVGQQGNNACLNPYSVYVAVESLNGQS